MSNEDGDITTEGIRTVALNPAIPIGAEIPRPDVNRPCIEQRMSATGARPSPARCGCAYSGGIAAV